MSERRGPNRRRKAAHRKARRRSAFAVAMPVLLIAAVCIATGIMVHAHYGTRLAALAARMNGMRNPSIDRVVVEGSFAMAPEELLRRAGITLPVTVEKLEKECLKKIAEINPWIEKARLVGSKKGTATLFVSERRPVALLQLGTVWLVDDAGICMPLKRGVSYNLPLASGLRDSVGNDGIRRLTVSDARRLVTFYSEIDRCDSAFAHTVAQLHFSKGGKVSMTLCGAPTIIFMREDAVAGGLELLARIWAMVATEARFPQRIDCSYRNLVFVSPAFGARVAEAKSPDTRKPKG
jgi:hypothetical protein